MTDLEMTNLCAEAMGFPNIAHELNKESVHLYKVWPDTPDGTGGLLAYDPLHDDDQAMALVKRFRLSLGPDASGGPVWCCWDNDNNDVKRAWDDDPNRAIVECVAKMQERKAGIEAWKRQESPWPDDFDCGFKHAMEIALLCGDLPSATKAMQNEMEVYTPHPGSQECPHCGKVRAMMSASLRTSETTGEG